MARIEPFTVSNELLDQPDKLRVNEHSKMAISIFTD